MSNRLTKGRARVGSLAVDTSGGVWSEGDKVCRKTAAIKITAPGTTVETDTNWDLPAYGIVHDIYVKITAASTASGTLSVGLSSTSSGDIDGFIISLGTSSTGVFYPALTFTAATSGDKVTGNTRGVLLSAHATGSTQDEYGWYAPIGYNITDLQERSVTFNWNTTQATPTGHVFIDYTEIA